MSPWDLYKNVLAHLPHGRLTLELADVDLRLEWWPNPNAMLAYRLTMREFQAGRWEMGQYIARELTLRLECGR